MASSMWSTVQASVPDVGGGSSDPSSLLNNQLASALSTMGDAQYWEESIAPSTIRSSLSASDPSNPNSTPTLLRGMKWLLACMSKGRDVSDFYPHVVKLVGAPSLEARKMVYMYLVHYADHDATTRELSLLSINSFQRGLADNEQLIRALALRVLSSIRVSDVLQIQILGVQKCAKDKSPYVRKCAANALAKLSPRCDASQRDMLLDIMKMLLDEDESTMVLTSSIIAFAELSPERLDLLHGCFRKICHLLTDMDEWGQVVVIDTFARYCRKFFQAPRRIGSAEAIDRERRVRRTLQGVARTEAASVAAALEALTATEASSRDEPVELPKRPVGPRKVKRRVVKKGFYSDEEDKSTEEEVYVDHENGGPVSVAAAMRQRHMLGEVRIGQNQDDDNEDDDLDEDHRLLLRSSLPLLKSRNSGVVLAVCSLHYYCGVASVKVRSALGKALVRIHRDRREIQYVVLESIRRLVKECPSAFTPFLQDFFVTAMDPSYTRKVKLDILTSLSLEPRSIEAVLKELRTYIRHDDKAFVCRSVRAVGKVVELAQIVHNRYGTTSGDPRTERQAANRVALNSLYGLMALTLSCNDDEVVSECATVMQQIMLQLVSGPNESVPSNDLNDPNNVMDMALKRLILLVARALSGEYEGDEVEGEREPSMLESVTVRLTAAGVTASLWILGEWLSSVSRSSILLSKLEAKPKKRIRFELIRLVARNFLGMEVSEKIQGVHFATKVLISACMGKNAESEEEAFCEHVLSLGRMDVNTDVRDRARFESTLVRLTVGLKLDTESLSAVPSVGRPLTPEMAKRILLMSRPPASWIPLEEEVDPGVEIGGPFRFGTLSSLVSHRARTAYRPLPKWSEKNSPSSLRTPPEVAAHQGNGDCGWKVKDKKADGFYDSEDEGTNASRSSDSSSNQSSSSESTSSDSDSLSDASSEEETESSSEVEFATVAATEHRRQIMPHPVVDDGTKLAASKSQALLDHSSSDDFSSSNSDSSDTSDSSHETLQKEGNLLSMSSSRHRQATKAGTVGNGTSLVEDLQGLVMAPVAVDTSDQADPNLERDSSAWATLVRPELAGGLQVTACYLRGPSRSREAKLVGLDPDQPTVVCLHVRLENRRTDSGTLRRVRIVQRSSGTGSIGPRRVMAPKEIVVLKNGQMASATLAVQFLRASDRDGALLARFDLKSDRGSNQFDIKPPLAEVLLPSKIERAAFFAAVERLQGFQRVVCSFSFIPESSDCVEDTYKSLSLLVQNHAALSSLPCEEGGKDFRLCLVGKLPESNDPVYVLIEYSPASSTGRITVCCDHALAANTLAEFLKHAIAN